MSPPNSTEQPSFSDKLLAWFDQHGRHDLPWQRPRTPYRVWLSEIMLQQTQVQTVIGYFERFVQAFPSLRELAEADSDHVLAHWAGLGYYARARNLQAAARLCVAQHNGELPCELHALMALPGIGRSTAGAILAQAHGERVAILDGNVKRTLSRFHGIEGLSTQPAVEKKLWQLAEQHLPESRLVDYTQAMMDFGATVCTRHKPACATCPVQTNCVAKRENRVDQFPTAKPTKALPHRQILMLVACDQEGRVLLERRPDAGIWAGLWSLPEVNTVQVAQATLSQHAQMDFTNHVLLATIKHTFSHFRLNITPLLCHQVVAHQRISDNDRYRWQPLSRLSELGLPAPIKTLLATLPLPPAVNLPLRTRKAKINTTPEPA